MPPTETNSPPTTSPYDFIVNEPKKQRKLTIFNSQTSFKQRILIILGGGLVLIILLIVLASIFSPKPKTAGLLTLGQQQDTLITLASSAATTANQQITINLATNIELSLTSEQFSVVKYLKTSGTKVTTASLLTTKATALSKELASTPSNSFDSEYVQLTQSQLSNYLAAIKRAFSSSDPVNQKVLLNNLYVSANLLLEEANTAANDL